MSIILYTKLMDVKYLPNFMRNEKLPTPTKVQVLRMMGMKKELILEHIPSAEFNVSDVQPYHPSSIRDLTTNKLVEDIINEHYGCEVIITRMFGIRGIRDKTFVIHGSHGYVDMVDTKAWSVTENCTPDKVFEEAMKKH